MTWQSLSDKQPRPGQAVTYRLRPNGVEVPATYDSEQPAWVLPDGGRQTARAHHQWASAESESTAAPVPSAPDLHRLDPTTRRLLRAAFEHHPDLLEEVVNAQGAA